MKELNLSENKEFKDFLNAIENHKIFVTGIGKSGIIAQRFAASLSSISFPVLSFV